jgi:hypothetical protein
MKNKPDSRNKLGICSIIDGKTKGRAKLSAAYLHMANTIIRISAFYSKYFVSRRHFETTQKARAWLPLVCVCRTHVPSGCGNFFTLNSESVARHRQVCFVFAAHFSEF